MSLVDLALCLYQGNHNLPRQDDSLVWSMRLSVPKHIWIHPF